ncbi:reverse transcriptase domain-containing protein [Tanacetum coccineum]
MPFGLKNARATDQRLVDTIFKGQIRRNMEAYVDDMVIKSKTEQDFIQDIEEIFLTLKKVNMKLNPKKCSVYRSNEEGKVLSYLEIAKTWSGKTLQLNKFLSKAIKRVIPCLDTLKKCMNKKDFRWIEAAEEAFQAMKRLIAELPTLTAPMKDEELMLYLSATNEIVSAVGHTFKVVMETPINQILNSPEVSRILAKWAVDLGAYGISYSLRNAKKGQVLADFLADTVSGDDPTCEKTPSSETTVAPEDVLE